MHLDYSINDFYIQGFETANRGKINITEMCFGIKNKPNMERLKIPWRFTYLIYIQFEF